MPEGGSPRYSPSYLASYFFADSADAALANADFAVEPLGEEPPPESRILQRGNHCRCEDGWLLLETSRWVAENVSGFESTTYRFRKTNDGAMGVQENFSGVGVVFVVLVAGNSTEWYGFLLTE